MNFLALHLAVELRFIILARHYVLNDQDSKFNTNFNSNT